MSEDLRSVTTVVRRFISVVVMTGHLPVVPDTTRGGWSGRIRNKKFHTSSGSKEDFCIL